MATNGRHREYWGCRSQEARLEKANQLIAEGWEVNERVDGAAPALFYLDIDGKEGEELDLPGLLEGMVHLAERLGIPEHLRAPAVLNGTRPGKTSYHLIADGWGLTDGAQVREIQGWFHEYYGGVVDVCASGRSYGLRVLGSTKAGAGEESRLRIESQGEGATEEDVWLQTGLYERIIDLEGLPTLRELTMFRASQKTKRILPPSEQWVDQELEGVIKEVEQSYPWLERREGTQAFDRTCSHWCGVCGRTHESDGAFLWVPSDRKRALLYCARDQSGEKRGPLETWELCMGEMDRAVREMVRPLVMTYEEEESRDDEYEGLTGVSTEEVNARYCTDGVELGRARLECIRSVCGTGKTRLFVELLRKIRLTNPEANMHVVSPRKTVTAQHAAATGMPTYQDQQGVWNPKQIRSMIWQIDAIERLAEGIRRSGERLDALILDEIVGLLAQVHGNRRTGGLVADARASGIMASLGFVLRNTQHVVVLDNDLKARHVTLLKQAMGLRDARVINNQALPWEGTPFHLLTGYRAHRLQEREMFAYLTEQVKARLEGRETGAIAVATHSKKHAARLAKMGTKICGDTSSVLLYTGDTDDEKAGGPRGRDQVVGQRSDGGVHGNDHGWRVKRR